jgi:transcriptional regulator with XRE-family HTH domain
MSTRVFKLRTEKIYKGEGIKLLSLGARYLRKGLASVCEASTVGFSQRRLRMGKKESFADYIRRVLKEKQLTHKDVERLCNKKITASTVNKIINQGMENLTALTIAALAEGIGESPESLFRRIIGKAPTNEPTSEIAALFYKYGQLEDDDKRELKSLLEVVDNEIERRRTGKK